MIPILLRFLKRMEKMAVTFIQRRPCIGRKMRTLREQSVSINWMQLQVKLFGSARMMFQQ